VLNFLHLSIIRFAARHRETVFTNLVFYAEFGSLNNSNQWKCPLHCCLYNKKDIKSLLLSYSILKESWYLHLTNCLRPKWRDIVCWRKVSTWPWIFSLASTGDHSTSLKRLHAVCDPHPHTETLLVLFPLRTSSNTKKHTQINSNTYLNTQNNFPSISQGVVRAL